MKFNQVKLYKPPGVHTYCFKVPLWAKPTKRHFNTRQSIKEEAERVRDEYLTQCQVRGSNQIFTEAYLDMTIDAFLTAKAGNAKKTRIKYKSALLEFKEFVVSRSGKMPRMQDIEKPLVEAFLQDVLNKPSNPHTVNDKRDIVASLFNYAVDNDWLVKSVVKKIKKLSEPESNSPDPLNQDEVIRVLDGCKRMDEDGKESVDCFYEIMAIIFYAGLRASEVTHLFPTDLDFNQGRILLRNKKIDYGDSDEIYRTKTKLHWFPPINDTLEAILKGWLKRREESKSPLLFPYIDGGPISVDYLFKKMKVIMERANFAPDRIARPLHRGRHTFASEATIAGVEEKYIQAALGHKTNAMTRKYVHLSPRFIADKFNKVSYGQNTKDGHNGKGK